MDGAVLQDRFSRGMGSAARALGLPHDVYRACGVDEPLADDGLVLRMFAAFDLGDPGYRRPSGYERALRGTFDGDCVRVGDYLRGPRGVLFIAMLPPLQRPLCVAANAVFDVLRAAGAEVPGLNGYGGVREPRLRTVLSGWPGSLLGAGGVKAGAFPGDGGQATWSVLLPVTPVAIMGSDLLRERSGLGSGVEAGAGVGRRFVVRAAERTELGWRLSVREAGV